MIIRMTLLATGVSLALIGGSDMVASPQSFSPGTRWAMTLAGTILFLIGMTM